MVLEFLSSHPSIFILASTYVIMGIIFLYWKRIPEDEDLELPDGSVIRNPTFEGTAEPNDNQTTYTVTSYDFQRNNQTRNSTERYTARNVDEVDYANMETLELARQQKNNNQQLKKVQNEVVTRNLNKNKTGPLAFKENGQHVQHSSGAYLHMDDFDDFDVISGNRENVMRITMNFDGDATTSYLNKSTVK